MIKRIFDIVFSILGLLVLSPFFLIISLLIPLDSRGPILFKQERVGYKGKRFKIYKFRTMVRDASKKGGRLTNKNDIRITRIGTTLRRYKIDELPQLLNVLRGEISFVGPRPELPEYVEFFQKDYEYILGVKPGITDSASIQFRNESELMENSENAEEIYLKDILPKKIEMYKQYVQEQSFCTDIRIIIFTILSLLTKKRKN